MTKECGPEPWHGTNGGYNNHRCRGRDCLEAHRKARKTEAA